MRSERLLLLIDAIINLALGVLLMVFPFPVIALLGLPLAQPAFYPSILGAVLFGIGIALLLERRRLSGLGLLGAVAINLSGGVVLVLWLIFGDLSIPVHGSVLLWALVVLLVGVSLFELIIARRKDVG